MANTGWTEETLRRIGIVSLLLLVILLSDIVFNDASVINEVLVPKTEYERTGEGWDGQVNHGYEDSCNETLIYSTLELRDKCNCLSLEECSDKING